MKYISGDTVQKGDRVLIEHGRTPGRVTAVVESSAEMAQCNVEEPGLMIESAPFGLVFWPTSSPDAVVLAGRATDA
jgi:hypothetical protein